MAANMNDFLLQYYMQYRFNHMPPAVRAQYDVYVKSNDFRGNMGIWKRDLMHQNPAGSWVENDMPDPTNSTDQFFMNDDEWKKLFLAFQSAFQNMAADRKTLEKNSPEVIPFIDKYFGNLPSQPFTNSTASPAVADLINSDFKDFLQRHQTSLEIQFQNWGILDKDFSYAQLLSGIASQKYNTSLSFQKKIKKIAQYIDTYSNSDEFRSVLRLSAGDRIPDFSSIISGFDNNTIDPNKMEIFRGNATTVGEYKNLLNTLVKNKKIYNVFKQYDDGKISGKLEEANKNLDYENTGSEDYVPPKRQEELTFFEKLRGDISDTLEDYMGKYLKLSGDRLYFSESAKAIVNAISGTGYKPTEGLDKILNSKEDIIKKLRYKSARATKDFEWFVETMSELKASMPTTFAGALKNGNQLRIIVEELIIKAIPGHVEEAKSAMEVLSVVKYSYTNSKIMEAFNKSDFVLFSDSALSFNKGNTVIQNFTKVMDNVLKASLQAVGYTATAAINAIKLSGSKFNGQANRIRTQRARWTAENEANRNDAIEQQRELDAIDRRTISEQRAELASLDSEGFNERRMPMQKRRLEVAKERAQRTQETYNRAKEAFDQADGIVKARQEISDLLRQRQALAQKVADLDREFRDPATYAGLTSEVAAAKAHDILSRKREAESQKKQKYQEARELTSGLRSMYTRDQIRDAVRDRPRLQTEMQNAEREHTVNQGIIERVETKINNYENATKLIEESSRHITERAETIARWDSDHTDEYQRLVAFWDMLETGRNLHLGQFYSWSLGSAKRKQRAFDAVKAAQFNRYVSDYNLAQ